MAKKQMTFEDAIARLEEIIENLESGELELDQSLKLYEEGIGLVRSCSQLLEKAEQSVKMLQLQADGGVALTNFQGSDL
jgi:exodeoxyribonuclease VII small subunit